MQVFEDRRFPPDLEFGCFAAIKGPQGSQWENKALLRVQMGMSARGRATMKANYVAVVLSLRELKKYAALPNTSYTSSMPSGK